MTGLRWRWLHLRRMAREWPRWAGFVGRAGYLAMAVAPVLGPLANRILPLRLRGYRHPVYYRDKTSDLAVARQVFADAAYGCVAAEPDVRFLVDCGANAGYAAFYLLHRYPAARAVVVEPDPGNLAVCRRTLAPFADRVTIVQAGVWSAAGPLVVDRGAFRDGGEWATQVRPARPGETPDCRGVTVADLLAAGGFPHVDLLKVDIEAAETEVFGPGCEAWLGRVRTLVIELHGAACERAVAAAVAGFPHGVSPSGELTVFRFDRPQDGAPPACS